MRSKNKFVLNKIADEIEITVFKYKILLPVHDYRDVVVGGNWHSCHLGFERHRRPWLGHQKN